MHTNYFSIILANFFRIREQLTQITWMGKEKTPLENGVT